MVSLDPPRPAAPAVLLAVFLCALLVRLPFFFPSVIDWDESTFILMGQHLADGHLPYVELWDNKPPLLFAFFALVLLVAPSIIAVRIAATLMVFAAAVIVWRAGSRLWGDKAGIFAALCTIVFVSLIPPYAGPNGPIHGGQAALSEIVAIVPLTGALLVLLADAASPRRLFCAGVLLCTAALVRTNLALVAIAIGVVLAALEVRQGARSWLRRMGAYVLGGIVPVALVFLPYIVSGQQRVLVDSMIIAPLRYADAFADTGILELVHRGFVPANIGLWGGCLAGVGLAVAAWRRTTADQRRNLVLLGAFLLSAAWSIVSSGSPYTHYLIQIFPFMALFAGYAFSRLPRAGTVLFAVALLAPARPLVEAYGSIGEFRSDAGYRIADWIAANNPQQEPIYMMTDHIVYWLLDVPPIARSVAHPSTVGKEYLLRAFLRPDATSEGELNAIFDRSPLFVVRNPETWYVEGRARDVLETRLARDYVVADSIDGRLIHRRVR